MSAMQLFPDLSKCKANELTLGIGGAAELYHSQVDSIRMMLPHTGLADLMGGLTLWLAGMKQETTVTRYTRMRQLISVVEHMYREEENQ